MHHTNFLTRKQPGYKSLSDKHIIIKFDLEPALFPLISTFYPSLNLIRGSYK